MKYFAVVTVCAIAVIAGYLVLRQYSTGLEMLDPKANSQATQSADYAMYENTALGFRAVTPPTWSVKEYRSDYGEPFIRVVSPNYTEESQSTPSGSYIYVGWIGGGGTQMYFSSPESYVAFQLPKFESMCGNCESASTTTIGGQPALLVNRDDNGDKSVEIFVARPVDFNLEPNRDPKRIAYPVGAEPTVDTGVFKEMIIAFTGVPVEIQEKFIKEFEFLK
ncbi:MAG: hypothetical protein WC217_00920 [Candidatus Paceibacterota bacterium]|jgi:hypothetical protein